MKFEELSTIWNSSDIELGKSTEINRKLVKELSLAKIKSQLYEIKWTGYFKIAVWIGFLLFLVGFIIDYFPNFQFSFPAIILLIISILSLIFEIYRLTIFYSIESKAPVIETQKKLSRLSYFEVLDNYSLYVIIPLFSAPFLIVTIKAVFDYSLYDTFGSLWIVLYTLGSALISIIVVFFLRKYPNKKLTESISFLNELKENE